MPGFFICNTRSNIVLEEYKQNDYVSNSYSLDMQQDSFFFSRNTLNKFMNDKVFYCSDSLVIIIEGYILNKRFLFDKYKANDMVELVEKMYDRTESFFNEFRGFFSGVIYQKSLLSCIVFTNQIGDNPVFFYHKDGLFAAASQINYILDWCKEQEINLTFNESCAYQMLTYGYIPSNETYANEILRLHGGDYLVYKNNDLITKQYHRFRCNKSDLASCSTDELVDMIDAQFKDAVYLEWEKDTEYGLSHISDISGGLDSRMNLWVAHTLLNQSATLLSYSKADYLDASIATEIAKYWGDELLFKALDDASFMRDIDLNTCMLGGLSLYSGITGGRRLLDTLDLSQYGIEHTGMIGDISLGSLCRSERQSLQLEPSGMYSERLKNSLPSHIKKLHENYDNYEVFLMYARGFHGACNTHLLRRNYTDVGSPFLNVDFLELCFSIPIDIRANHYIYKRWILQKYPDAALFKWEKTNSHISEKPYKFIIRKMLHHIIRKSKAIITHNHNSDNMNPLDYWISKNPELKAFLDTYEHNGYQYIPNTASSSLIKDMKELYSTGNAMEQSMVLTVLSACKLYFGDDKPNRNNGSVC